MWGVGYSEQEEMSGICQEHVRNIGNVSGVLRGKMPELAGAEDKAKAKMACELIYQRGHYSKWE